MAASSEIPESYSKMSVGDVEAIGAHCQMTFCHQLDFLPFKCESCQGKFCLDHRTESAHSCPQAGAWARRRAQANGLSTTSRTASPRPNILTHEQQCSLPACKTLIDTPLVTGVLCETCNRRYCLKHRMAYEHECSKLAPIGARTNNAQAARERGLAALEKLRAWGASKKSAVKVPQTKSRVQAATRLTEVTNLKRTAKGDVKIPAEKRIFLFVEASSDTLVAKLQKGSFFYSVDYSVGRMLDLAATSLQVSNVNNRSGSEEDKLRVFHVEGGRLLDFNEKLGAVLQTGNTLVLLRGVGADMAKTPDNT
ncbi:hypothetical protein AMS68_006841 [Peltaster fructicola]|uniref:AN1-type domain-containing protein n=1 Tax=Peltaster fructicola TaxID=286661 RepID=A0A6H0Y2T7_9PEZI|nr:hypothetical protein AMS68_006841 [Peltaster fructicola]